MARHVPLQGQSRILVGPDAHVIDVTARRRFAVDRSLELPRFRGHLMTALAQSERMSVDAKDAAVFRGVQREAVRLLRTSGRSQNQLAEALGVSKGSLAAWAKQLDVDEGKQPGLTSDEREELRRLRREVKVLTEERRS